MDRAAYFVWLLLPLALAGLCLWSVIKKQFKIGREEDSRDYFKQLLFVSVALAVAIGLDKLFADPLLDHLPDQEENIGIVRWLVYPTVLLVMAYLLGIRDKKVAAKEREKKAKRPGAR